MSSAKMIITFGWSAGNAANDSGKSQQTAMHLLKSRITERDLIILLRTYRLNPPRCNCESADFLVEAFGSVG